MYIGDMFISKIYIDLHSQKNYNGGDLQKYKQPISVKSIVWKLVTKNIRKGK